MSNLFNASGQPIDEAGFAKLTEFNPLPGLAMGGVPAVVANSRPHVWTFSYRNRVISLSSGFYLMVGGTKGGKSVGAAALTSFFLRARLHGEVKTVPALEDPVTPMLIQAYEANVTRDAETNKPLLRDPATLITDLTPRADLTGSTSGAPDDRAIIQMSENRVLILDSVTHAIQAYNPNNLRATAGTGSKGQNPADLFFVVALQEMARTYKAIIIGVINTDELPFADKLEAQAEGALRFSGMTLNYDSRNVGGRLSRTVPLPVECWNDATRFLNYGPFRQDDLQGSSVSNTRYLV